MVWGSAGDGWIVFLVVETESVFSVFLPLFLRRLGEGGRRGWCVQVYCEVETRINMPCGVCVSCSGAIVGG